MYTLDRSFDLKRNRIWNWISAHAQIEFGFENTRFMRWTRRNYARLKTPLGSLAFALLIALVCGFFIHERCLMVAFWIGVIISVGWVLPRFIANNVLIQLIFEQEYVVEGEDLSFQIRIQNKDYAPLIGLVVDTKLPTDNDLDRFSGAMDHSCLKMSLPPYWPWSKVPQSWSAHWIASRRGQFPHDQPKVGCSFPFQVREYQSPITMYTKIKVHPRTYIIPEWPDFAYGTDDFGLTLAYSKGNAGDTISLRDFRRGDDPRRVHWPQTARLGHLVVREQQASIKPRLTIHLEDPSQYKGWTLEWAVRLAASFLEGAQKQGWQCDLKLGHEGGENARYFHHRTAQFYLDLLAIYGFDHSFDTINSDACSDEVPRDQLQIRIVSADSETRWPVATQEFLLLGRSNHEFYSSQPAWLHFEEESDLKQWLKISEVIS